MRHRVSVAEDYTVGIGVVAPVVQPESRGKLPQVEKPPTQKRPASKPKAKTPAKRKH